MIALENQENPYIEGSAKEAVQKMVWLLNQDKLELTNIKDVLIEWNYTNNKSKSQESAMREVVHFMQELYSIEKSIPQFSRQAFVEGALESLQDCGRPYNAATNVPMSVRGEYLCAMYQLALAFPEVSIGGFSLDCLSKSWAMLTFADARQSQREELALIMLNSNISEQWLYIVLMCTTPDLWCLPKVHEFLLPLLNEDEYEYERIDQLPWVGLGALVLQHEPMEQLYCPTIYPLLSMLVQAEEWKSQTHILDLVRSCRMLQHITGLNVPQDAMEML